MGLELTRDAEDFAARVEPFLAARVERNVLATVLYSVRVLGPYGDEPPLFATLTDDSTQAIAGVAIRTPPWPLLAAGWETGRQAVNLMHAWLEHDPDPPGVSGEPDTARALAAAYESLTGHGWELQFAEALHALTQVTDPPRPAPGALRQATDADKPTLLEWERGFIEEAGMGDPNYAEKAVQRRLTAGLQYVWTETNGAPVSTLGHNQPIARAVRIGPVYTPQEHRNHGYASSAVAVLSRQLLATRAERCLLFTDLANPTSNKIYASVGYVRIADWEQHRFI